MNNKKLIDGEPEPIRNERTKYYTIRGCLIIGVVTRIKTLEKKVRDLETKK